MAAGEAVGALALGMAGQVIYHLLAAAHASRAPWPVVVLVSCLPVVMLGFGAALAHLLHTPPDELGETAPVPTEPAAVTAAGNPLSQRQLTSRFGLTRPTAAKVGPAGGAREQRARPVRHRGEVR
jgi:hypothetical protein